MKFGKFITSKNPLFSSCITSTKHNSNMKETHFRDEFLNSLSLNPKNLITANQVHGNNIAIVSSLDKGKIIDNCDGFITKDKNVILGIYTADCIPVFMISTDKSVKAVIHSGWRSLAGGILEKAVEIFQKNFFIKPNNINVYMGPHIQKCCYEVGKEFEKTFSIKLIDGKINLSEVAKKRLTEIGVSNIEVSDICTYCSGELFSYRREKTMARQINVIV